MIVRGDSHLGMPRGALKKTLQAVAYPALMRVFDAVAFVGQRSKEYFLHFGYPAERLFYSPHCVDTQWFASKATSKARFELRGKLDISQEALVVLFAGKLVPFKRPLDVVDAAAALRQQGIAVELIIAGAGALEGRIREEAARHHLPIHMLGFQNQSQMPAAYAAADALVLPSDGRETWGLVCNEALASGTPIVVSDAIGCAPDLAADGLVGRRFAYGSSDACASALSALLRSPPSHHAIAQVSQRFSLDAAVNGISAALDSVTTGSPRPTQETAHAHST
ncbi:MAG: glycosyltransferase family 4 protein [Hyphomonadaceae bacterium]|nr:glycosyltransferase family 4 protein [Hyphomonadaceae bacterium]